MNSSATMLFLLIVIIAVVGLVIWAFVGSRKKNVDDDDDISIISGAASKSRNSGGVSPREDRGFSKNPDYGMYAQPHKTRDAFSPSRVEAQRYSYEPSPVEVQKYSYEPSVSKSGGNQTKANFNSTPYSTVNADMLPAGAMSNSGEVKAAIAGSSIAPAKDSAASYDKVLDRESGGAWMAGQSAKPVEDANSTRAVDVARLDSVAEPSFTPGFSGGTHDADVAKPVSKTGTAAIHGFSGGVRAADVAKPASATGTAAIPESAAIPGSAKISQHSDAAKHVRPAGVAGFCPACGKPFRGTDIFCGSCGKSLADI